MIRLATALTVLSVLSLPQVVGSAHAQRVSRISGKALGGICSNAKGLGVCDAYIAGVTDSEVWAKSYDKFAHDAAAPVAFCVPTSQTTSQIRGVVVAWLHAHEDAQSEPAGKGVYRALHENYPCPHAGEEHK